MKKFVFIFGFLFCTVASCFAQDDDTDNGNGNEKIREKMSEFIQKRMNLTKAEAEKFNPVFIRYFKEWKETIRANRNDRPVMQLRVAELRIRYRNEFREIVGERRCNQIYDHQERFIQIIRELKEERMKDRRNIRRNRSLLQ